MRLRFVSFGLLVALLGAFVVAPLGTARTASAAPVTNQVTDIPITGTSPSGATFRGTLDLVRFVVRDGQLVAVGTLTGTLRNAAGTVVGTVDRLVSLPVTQTTGSCQILRLVLGPLDLNLLGLRVQLNRVVLDITAEAGPGNLLGNLLCAVARLLDRGGALSQLSGLLNRILGVLG